MIIGITGGVGCGKSVVMKLLEAEFGVHAIYADIVGHEVMTVNGEAYEDIISEFGNDILISGGGEIDRKKLGEIVFNDKLRLDKLNSIIHPAVKKRIINKIKYIRNNNSKAIIAIEAALLLEDNYDAICDTIWYVYADKRTRRKRLKESRGYSDEKIDSIMKNQLTEKVFRARCDEVINNSKDIDKTRKNLQKILDKYRCL